MIVQLGNVASETKCEDTFMSFYPHSSTSSKGNLEGQVSWTSGLGSQARVVFSAVPSKAQAFHPGSSSIANLLSQQMNSVIQKEQLSPDSRGDPTNGKHKEKQCHLPKSHPYLSKLDSFDF